VIGRLAVVVAAAVPLLVCIPKLERWGAQDCFRKRDLLFATDRLRCDGNKSIVFAGRCARLSCPLVLRRRDIGIADCSAKEKRSATHSTGRRGESSLRHFKSVR